MNPNPKALTEYELVKCELGDMLNRVMRRLDDAGCPTSVKSRIEDDLQEQLRWLRIACEAEARRALAQSAEAWPTVDRIDLHLPETPAPAGKVFAGIDGDEAIWFQVDGYYCLNRKTGTTRALTNPVEIDIMRQGMETIGRRS